MILNESLFFAGQSFLAVIGISTVIYSLISRESLNYIEKRLRVVLLFLVFLFTFRASSTLFYPKILSHLENASAVAMIVAFALYFEAYLRRHFPLWLKVSIALGAIYFFIASMTGFVYMNKFQLIGLGGYGLLVSGGVLGQILFRKRSEYSKVENNLLNINALALSVLAPLFLTDIPYLIGEYVPPLGSLAALIFTYLSIHIHAVFSNYFRLLLKLLGMLLFSTFLSLMLFLIVSELMGAVNFIRFVALNFSALLCVLIFIERNRLSIKDPLDLFIYHLSIANTKNSEVFLKNLAEFFPSIYFKKINIEQYQLYNLEKIREFVLRRGSHVISIDQVNPQAAVEEEIVSLLSSHQMTHLACFGNIQPIFIVFSSPMVGYSRLVNLQINLVAKMVKLIENKN